MVSPTLSPTRNHKLSQPLSPERINGLQRSLLTSISSATKSTKPSSTESEPAEPPEQMLSPSRKANLFADYVSKSSDTKITMFGPPGSPSLPDMSSLRSHARTNSDVQGLVKRFEHLDVRDRDAENLERRKRHEAELKRAQMAREEAESDVKRLRAELRSMKKEADEGRERERMVAKRLEVVMEEFANSKESHASAIGVYDKEIRKARKEAFKTSSAVLKLQEELKSTRNSLRITQAGFEMEKQKVQRKEQDAFEAQYQLVAAQEELEKAQANLQLQREENEGLKTSLKEEEIARMAAEGMIALPTSQENDDDLLMSPQRSPRRRPASPLSDDKENQQMSPRKSAETRRLQTELAQEKARREYAEEMVEFARLECLYRCCSCRVTKLQHEPIPALPDDLVDAVMELQADAHSFIRLPKSQDDVQMEDSHETFSQPRLETDDSASIVREHKTQNVQDNVTEIEKVETLEMDSTSFSEHAETNDDPFVNAAPMMRSSHNTLSCVNTAPRFSNSSIVSQSRSRHRERTRTPPSEQISDRHEVKETRTMPIRSPTPESPHSHKHSTPFRSQPSITTITTTTTIPMQFTPVSKPVAKVPVTWDPEDRENIAPAAEDPFQLPPIDREAALAAIQYRRGRARSIANGQITPRKQMLEGVNVNERRDISAPVQGSKILATGVAKSASAGRGTAKR